MRIDIWSDVVCPWCYIGKRRFERALATLESSGNTEPIEIVYRSYQLDPTAPKDRATPVIDAYAKKFGGIHRAEQILSNMTGIAAQEGLVFKMDQALRANTFDAHRVLHWTLVNHGSVAQARLKESMLDAYFCSGVDVADHGVLLALCEAGGHDTSGLEDWLHSGGGQAEVLADIAAANDRGITGVPAYVIDDRFLIPGAQDPELFLRIITKMLER